MFLDFFQIFAAFSEYLNFKNYESSRIYLFRQSADRENKNAPSLLILSHF